MSSYSSAIDSGIPWLGKVPSHWKIEKAKTHFRQTNSRGNDVPVLLAATQKFGMIPQDRLEGVVKVKEGTDLQEFKTVHRGDFVISLRSFQGGFEKSDYEGVCSPAYQTFHAFKPINENYYKYLFKSVGFIEEMNSLTVGIREGKNIKYSDFANSYIVYPPLEEQEEIANYLDGFCHDIDSEIEEITASIEDYKALKRSVISSAVLKGLDKKQELIESKIKWLGAIPASWRVRKINACFSIIGSGTTPSSIHDEYYIGDVSWLQSGDINGGEVLCTEKQISQDVLDTTSALTLYKAPYIAIAMYGASIGNVSIVQVDSCTNQACCVLCNPDADILLKYVYYVIIAAKEELLLSSRGGTQPNISQSIIKQLRIPLPPYGEQEEIVKWLDDKVKDINLMIDEKQELLDDLEVFRKSYIFEVVTGKRKVV